MNKQNDDVVRINRTPFSETWEVVKVSPKGVITARWRLHPDDAATLERHYQQDRGEES